MAWQDSHFSLSYDRPSTTAVSQPNIAYSSTSQPGSRSYFETLTRIISLVLEVVRGRMLSPHSQLNLKTIQAYKGTIQQILTEAKPHLRDRKFCASSTDHLERVVLRLHSSYFLSELCRPAIKASADVNDPVIRTMRVDCVSNLMATVETYIEMHTISSHASRSWITMQRAVSSAFLLAVIEESKVDPRILTLLRHLEAIIAERANVERAFDTTTGGSGGGGATAGEGTAGGAGTAGAAGAGASAGGGGESSGHPGYDSGGAVPTPAPSSSISPSVVNPTSPPSMAVGPDPQTQWAKPLAKTLRALQKLNSAFNPQRIMPMSNDAPFAMYSSSTSPGAMGVGARLATTTTTAGPSVHSGLTPGSLPPPTPESSTSSEWTVPNIMDRAAEYIHPPLWG